MLNGSDFAQKSSFFSNMLIQHYNIDLKISPNATNGFRQSKIVLNYIFQYILGHKKVLRVENQSKSFWVFMEGNQSKISLNQSQLAPYLRNRPLCHSAGPQASPSVMNGGRQLKLICQCDFEQFKEFLGSRNWHQIFKIKFHVSLLVFRHFQQLRMVEDS